MKHGSSILRVVSTLSGSSLDNLKSEDMSTKIEKQIARLKAEAASYKRQFDYLMDDYDCGIHMAEHMNPQVGKYRRLFNRTMDELAKLDPACPKERL